MAVIEANGVQLYYELHGSPDAFPLVFINGLLSDTTSWTHQVPWFARHFRVLVYDCRGQGQSGKPPGPYTQAHHAADLSALLDALGIAQAHLVGLSNGGTVAMQLALSDPARLARLVLVDTFAGMDDAMRTKLESWLLALRQGGTVARFDVAVPWVWGRDFLHANAHLLELMRARAAQADPEAIAGLIMGTLDYDLRTRLADIVAPALVLVGEEDVLTPPWYSRELAEAIPHARLLNIPHAGHALPVEAPTLFNILVLHFLQEDTPR